MATSGRTADHDGLPDEPPEAPRHDEQAEAEKGFELLRNAILGGELGAGEVYSALQLSRRFGIGRTPLREAIRRLQGEALLEAERNRRIRVAPLDVDDLKQLYALRITLEALAVRLSVPHLTDDDVRDVRLALGLFLDGCRQQDLQAVVEPHRAFHEGIEKHAGARIRRELAMVHTHTKRYRRLFFHGDDQMGLFRMSAEEHEAIYAAAAARDGARCAELVAEHVARSAVILVARLGGGLEDPTEIRAALRLVTLGAAAANSPARDRKERTHP